MSNRQRMLHLAIYALYAAVAFAVIIFITASPVTNNPVVCSGSVCHGINPAYQSWKTSSHARLNCRDCHIQDSYLEITNEKFVQYPKRFWMTIWGVKEPINATNEYSQTQMPSERCARCHKNKYRVFTFSSGITMNHDVHETAGIACAVCHNRVAHPKAEKYDPIDGKSKYGKFAYKDFLNMKDGCWRCHSSSNLFRNPETMSFIKKGKTPPSDCRACHNHDFPFPEGHLDKKWRANHKTIAKAKFDECLTCHAAGKKFDNKGDLWCTLCHDEKSLLKKVGR